MEDPLAWKPEASDPIHERIEEHRAYARSLARQIHAKLPSHVSFDELEQDAMLGLTKAAQRFNASRDAAFTTFAYKYVRGAVFDGIRKQTWLPPALRRMEAQDAVVDGLAPPDPEASLDELVEQFYNPVRMLGAVYRLSDLVERDSEEELDPESGERTEVLAGRLEAAEQLRAALERLPEDQRKVIEGHYLEGKSFRELSVELDLHPANVTRRHQAALLTLASWLSGLNEAVG